MSDYDTEEYDDCEVRIFKDVASMIEHLENSELGEDKPLTLSEYIDKEWDW